MTTTNTVKKLTKRDRFNALLNLEAVQADKGMVEFIQHELELLEKKNSADKKPTAQQEANKGIKTAILNGLNENQMYTVTEIQKNIPECAELSNQRVSALCRQMVADGLLIRTEEKRKAYFSLAKIED